MKTKTLKSKFIKEIDKLCENKEKYVKNPLKDYTRTRKLTLKDTILIDLSMKKGSILEEVSDYFNIKPTAPTISAFIQQKDKISEQLYIDLFKNTNKLYKNRNKYKGYELIAVDGSDLRIPTNKNDKKTYYCSTKATKGYNLLHLNALFNILDKKFEDIYLQGKNEVNENTALLSMLKVQKKASSKIIIGDRNYESYNNIAFLNENKFKFLIRIKSKKGIISKLKLPEKDEYSENIKLVLTKQSKKEYKSNSELFRILPKKSSFEFLDKENFYNMNFRVVKITLRNKKEVFFVTNLYDFSLTELKEIYNLRWGIETAYRELKYSTFLNFFHHKKKDFIVNEIYSRIILYNFSMYISMSIPIAQAENRKHQYQINFTKAISICRKYLISADLNFQCICENIKKNILPIRLGRTFPRITNKSLVISFTYR